MRKAIQSWLFLICSLVMPIGIVTAQTRVEVSSAESTKHIQKKIDAEYPVIAKSMHLEGIVVLKAVISSEGKVKSVNVVSGHPMLVTAAVNSVKQWEYIPFIVDGHPLEVTTVVEVPFSLGTTKQQENTAGFHQQQDLCREKLRQGGADAETACTQLVELAEKLSSERQLERLTAYQYLGHAFYKQQKFSDALMAYQRELKIAGAVLHPTDAELGYAYCDLARALRGTGDLQQAHAYYDRAERTLEQAREHIGSAFLKNEYSAGIKTVLQEEAALLRQTGDEAGADALAQRADAIVVRTDLKD